MVITSKKTVFSLSDKVKNVEFINLGLLVLLFIMGICTAIVILRANKDINVWVNSQSRAVETVPVLNLTKKSIKYYERVLGRRPVFTAESGEKKPKAVPEVALQAGLDTQVSDLQLQGIISGNKGLQAIIENTKTSQTFYCSGGESVGIFLVKEVFTDRVTLETDGQIIELRL